MIFVNYKIGAPREAVMASLSESNTVVSEEKLGDHNGKPKIHVTDKGDKVKLVCEMLDAPTKDVDFKHTTAFRGMVRERDGVTKITGVILTAPIYHLVLFILFAFFIYKCFVLGGFSVVPVCLIVFDVFMFWREFKKQGIIKRYIFRALKITYRQQNRNK